MGCAGARAGTRAKISAGAVTGRCCGRKARPWGWGREAAKCQPGKAQLSQRRSLTFILKAKGGSELGSDRIKAVFMEDQSGWAWPEDILEQSDWGRWKGAGPEGQREDVYVSRSCRAGDDVCFPPLCRPARLQGPSHLPARRRREHRREKENFSGTQRARQHCLLPPPSSKGLGAQLRV